MLNKLKSAGACSWLVARHLHGPTGDINVEAPGRRLD
jgi:hypothetical protein